MVKVITYGTYDLLHYGHIRLLERAKALGDYLIVGVTSDSFDLTRGKINAQQSLMERIEAVRATGLADEIIVEEYEGQKIDDIKRLGVDIFTVGSDWKGHFDYLNEYCKVVYLDRTEGISSSELRAEKRELRLGLVGESTTLNKFAVECGFVNGIRIVGYCSSDTTFFSEQLLELNIKSDELEDLLPHVDALYISSHPSKHYDLIRKALNAGKHVMCESPIVTKVSHYEELKQIAKKQNCILMDAIKTAYSSAYHRMLLIIKSGAIGDVVSVDSICTSLSDLEMKKGKDLSNTWNSLCAWGPIAMLPIFQILGTKYNSKMITSLLDPKHVGFDLFTKIAFVYPHAVASLKVGKGVKSEGELIVSGTKGYVWIPAPWWKTEYFEVRYENPADNKRYFFQLDGEGIRNEIVNFVKSIETGDHLSHIDEEISTSIIQVVEDSSSSNIITI